MPLRSLVLVLLLLAAPALAFADAVAVDGVADAAYGPVRVVQTLQSAGYYADSQLGLLGPAWGLELDGAYAVVADGTLYVTLAGNLLFQGNPVDYGAFVGNFELFIDCLPGGQNALRSDNWIRIGSGATPGGLIFDAGFAPDFWVSCSGTLADFYDPNSAYTLHASWATLPSDAGGTGYVLGGTGAGGPGILGGGTNPDGIRVTIDDRNVAGVTVGCDAASGAGVISGVEWAIPLAALGNPQGCIRLCAIATRSGGRAVTNQVLGPLPAGSCGFTTGTVPDFSVLAGDQFFDVCASTPARATSWGALKTIYR
jgi:hypothetical protein